MVKFLFSKKATKIDEIFTVDLTLGGIQQLRGQDEGGGGQKMEKFCPRSCWMTPNVKSTVKISSIFVAFLENMNFNSSKQVQSWEVLETHSTLQGIELNKFSLRSNLCNELNVKFVLILELQQVRLN